MRKSKLWKKSEQRFAKYEDRYTLRKMQLLEATQNLIEYYENLGDDRENAEIKVTQISRAISTTNGGAKTDYFLGDTQQLVDILQAIDETTYPFFDQSAKTSIINDLQPEEN